MDQPDQDQPLQEIETAWSDVLLAHLSEEEAHTARARLVLRYIGAVRRYMARVLRDGDAAAELAQEFAVRVLRGDFRRADPSRGRFRDFVRTAALNLVHDYRRRCKTRPPTRSVEASEPVAPQVESDELDAILWSCAASCSAAPWPRGRVPGGPAARTTISSAFGPATPAHVGPNGGARLRPVRQASQRRLGPPDPATGGNAWPTSSWTRSPADAKTPPLKSWSRS